MITLFPTSGTIYSSVFSISSNASLEGYTVNWGDGTVNNTFSHTYSSIGVFNPVVTNCATTSSFALTAFAGSFLPEDIQVSFSSLSGSTSCLHSFQLSVSSQEKYSTIYLYSSGSNSQPFNDDTSFWQHLKPEWAFYWNDNPVAEITLEGTPVLSGNALVVGYSASAEVFYKDDMPGTPNLFFTKKINDKNVAINSRVYESYPFTLTATVPDKIFISSDGINPISPIQWANTNIPFVTTIYNSQDNCSTVIHYASGYLTDIKYATTCYGLSSNEYQTFLQEMNPYAIQNLFVPASALPENVLELNVSCDQNPYEQVPLTTRLSPRNISISATGVFDVGGITYTLSGTSEPFNIYPFENFHQFVKKNEDKSLYDLIARYSHFNLNNYPTFNSYLSAIADDPLSFGTLYSKIRNFNQNLSDIDLCEISNIYDIAQKLDVEVQDFGLEFPEELKQALNSFSVPLQKLVGNRCGCNTNFTSCKNLCSNNTCSFCGYDKKSNLGNIISPFGFLTAGETVLFKEQGDETYRFFTPETQNNETLYQLNTLSASPFFEKGINNYCFFEWNKEAQNFPVESLIDYKNMDTKIDPDLISFEDWFGDEGVVEETINYILTKNLL